MNLSDGRILYWRDKRVDELTRDELLAAHVRLCEMLEQERRWSRTVGETGDALVNAARRIYRHESKR